MPRKLLFIDVEATGDGTDKNHTILSIGGVLVIGNEVVDKIYIRMKPKNNAKIEYHKTLANTHSKDNGTVSQKIGFNKFIAFLDKYVKRYNTTDKLIGIAFNATFEQNHLINWFAENNHKYLSSYILPPIVCVQQLTNIAIPHIVPLLKKRTLAAVASAVDIEYDSRKLHNAYYDAYLCMRVYFALEKRMIKKLRESAL